MQTGKIDGAEAPTHPEVLTPDSERLQAYVQMREDRFDAADPTALPGDWIPEADRQLAFLREHTREASDAVVEAELDRRAVLFHERFTTVFVVGLALMLVPLLWALPGILIREAWKDLGALAFWCLITGAIAGFGWLRRRQLPRWRAAEAVFLSTPDDAASMRSFYTEEVLPHPELAEVAALWRTRGIPLREHEKSLLRRARVALEDRQMELRLARAGLHPDCPGTNASYESDGTAATHPAAAGNQ